MFSCEEIKDVLDKTSIEELIESYESRQVQNLTEDKVYIDRTANELDFLQRFLNPGLTNVQRLLSYIAIAMKTGGDIKDIVLNVLHYYGYNTAGEFLKTMQFADKYFAGELNFSTFDVFAHSSLTLEKISQYQNKILVSMAEKTIPLDAISKKEDLAPSERRQLCHNLTSLILLKNPNLLGAYYYIPLFFKGAIEHSILIDPLRNMVYDLANNIALPLSCWEKFYPTPSFTIKGSEFKEISTFVQDQYGKAINTANLEEIKRRRKK